MDIDEGIEVWEEDVSIPELNDNALDFAIASSLELKNSIAADFSSTTKELSKKNEIFLEHLDKDLDFAFALSLQTQYKEELNENTDIALMNSRANVAKDSKPLSIVDEKWELIDPHPDIHELFLQFNTKYFYGKLLGVEVKWCPDTISCAGICRYIRRSGRCIVVLSLPLLKFRPRRDLVETLLHEMIHAYLFVTHNNKDRDDHGPEFLSHMNRINKEAGTRISFYHSFHDEVDFYKTHWWECDGPCKGREPFYGLVKRAKNYPPGASDSWWADHQESCGGKFTKIREPEDCKKKSIKRISASDSEGKEPLSKIESFFEGDIPKSSSSENNYSIPLMTKSSNISTITSVFAKEENVVPVKSESPKKNFVPFGGGGHKLGGSSKNLALPPCKSESKESHPLFKSKSEFSSVLPMSNPFSRWAKFPRLSNSSDLENTDFLPSTSLKPDMSSRKLVQSPMEKFLSPKKEVAYKSSDTIPRSPEIIELDSYSRDSIVNCPK